MTEKLYAQRDERELGEHYCKHVMAMTSEQLHSKADIAAELAYRDARIEELEKLLDRALLGNSHYNEKEDAVLRNLNSLFGEDDN